MKKSVAIKSDAHFEIARLPVLGSPEKIRARFQVKDALFLLELSVSCKDAVKHFGIAGKTKAARRSEGADEPAHPCRVIDDRG
jgi:hypothetical protein